MKRRNLVIAAAALGATSFAVRSRAATTVMFGYNAVSDYATSFIAKEEGYFSKRALDVELKLMPINPAIPSAIESDSLQIGGPTPSVFLQSIDGGLDHVVLAGGGLTSKNMTGVGLVARPGSAIKSAGDCVGKKIGVPGLGAYLHVAFRVWLKQSGVDYTKVNFVEASIPQHGDLLRGGTIDAVVTADPFMARILSSNTGYVASYFTTFLPDGMPTILYVARRQWVTANALAAKAFHESIVEAAGFLVDPKNSAKVRQHIGKYIKLPPEVIATIQIGPPGPTVSAKQLSYWVDVMKSQGMLKSQIDVSRLIAA